MTELSALPAHHQASIARVVAHFEHDPEVQALLLTGSLAHGFYRENSDVDIAIVVSSADYQARLARGELGFFSDTLCTYPGGYADGKYIDLAFIQTVAERGSEPARLADSASSKLMPYWRAMSWVSWLPPKACSRE